MRKDYSGIELHHKETSRLVLRPLELSDYDSWFDSHINRLTKQHKYDDEKVEEKYLKKDIFNSIVETHTMERGKDIYHGVSAFDKINEKHIGKIDITTILRGEFQWAILGYNVHNTFQNLGYGTEMLKAAIEMSFNELKYKRVEAHINIDNERSLRIAEKAGMYKEVVRKQFIYEFGAWTDNVVYVCLNEKLTGSPFAAT